MDHIMSYLVIREYPQSIRCASTQSCLDKGKEVWFHNKLHLSQPFLSWCHNTYIQSVSSYWCVETLRCGTWIDGKTDVKVWIVIDSCSSKRRSYNFFFITKYLQIYVNIFYLSYSDPLPFFGSEYHVKRAQNNFGSLAPSLQKACLLPWTD